MASEKNPITDYLEKKSSWSSAGRNFMGGAALGARKALGAGKPGIGGGLGQMAGGGMVHAGLAAAGAAGIALSAMAVHKLYDAATKTRDFKSMLQYSPDLAELHTQEPQQVNQMFSTLRTFNPDFTRDPVVASSYVRRMVSEAESGGAGGIAVEALQHRDVMKSPFDNVQRAAFGAMGKKDKDKKKPES